MSVLLFTLLVGSGAVLAGFLGALTGLGGGVVIVPLLALVFGVDIHYAIGASLISVIATSSGAAAAYVREGYSNIRIGMFLEIATTIGALAGAYLADGRACGRHCRDLRHRAADFGLPVEPASDRGRRQRIAPIRWRRACGWTAPTPRRRGHSVTMSIACRSASV